MKDGGKKRWEKQHRYVRNNYLYSNHTAEESSTGKQIANESNDAI